MPREGRSLPPRRTGPAGVRPGGVVRADWVERGGSASRVGTSRGVRLVSAVLLRGSFGLFLGDLRERDAELHAQPTLDGGRVRELPTGDELLHAGVAVGAFFALELPVDGSGDRPVIANPVVADSGGHAVGHDSTPVSDVSVFRDFSG